MRSKGILNIYGGLLHAYGRFFTYAKPDTAYFALTILAILGIAATNTAMIWFIGAPFDMFQSGEFARIYSTLMVFAFAVLLNQGFHMGESVLSRWLGLRFVARLRSAFFSHFLFLSFPVVADYPRGDQLSRLNNDVDNTADFILEAPFYLASHFFIFIFYTVMLFWIDWRLALLAVAVTPIFLVHQYYFGPRKRRVSEEFLARNDRLVSLEEEALGNLRGVSSFGAEAHVTKRHGAVLNDALKWSMKQRWLDIKFNTTLSLLIYFAGLAVVVAGVYGISEGRVSAGRLVSFLLYLGYLSVPVRGFAELLHAVQGQAVSARRIMEILDRRSGVVEAPDAKPLSPGDGTIELRNVSFGYPGAGMVLSGVSLTIPGGRTAALVGASGSGKSTLVKLLLRFYDPVEGCITIGGQEIRGVTHDSLRDKVAVVWQEPFLINGTIRENLLMAAPGASERALMEACEASNALEFVNTLDGGLDTVIGAGGVELSAGQRQRVAIAQAFLRDAPVLVLDEASSALDSHNEQMITGALKRLRHGRTTMIIAHRYSSIKDADQVVYFNGDGTVTTGRHAGMIETHPCYRSAVEWQAGIDVLAGNEAATGGV